MPGFRQAYKLAKRMTPVAVEAYRRWDRMSPEEKERHRKRAMAAAARARDVARVSAERVRKRR
jgi:hypothetical protein